MAVDGMGDAAGGKSDGLDDDDEIIAAVIDDTEKEVPEVEQEEVQPFKCVNIPTEPTQQQRAEHRCVHWPYRSWCRDCTRGRGQHDQHRTKKGDKKMPNVPTISIDYVFIGTETVEAKNNAFLFMYDNSGEAPWAYRTGKKGIPDWLIPAILQDLESAGYGGCRICIRSDQENLIKKVKTKIIMARQGETVPQESPVRESQCNGKMEQAVKAFEGQLRTFMCALETETGIKIRPNSKAYGYMTTWACTVLTRYKLTSWGKSPFELLTGHQCHRPIVPFGTPVLWKQAIRDPNRAKGESDWGQGIFLGVKWRTSEAIVSVGDGIELCRTIRIDPESKYATKEMIDGIPMSVIEFLYSHKDSSDGLDDYEPNDNANSVNDNEPNDNVNSDDEHEVAALLGGISVMQKMEDQQNQEIMTSETMARSPGAEPMEGLGVRTFEHQARRRMAIYVDTRGVKA